MRLAIVGSRDHHDVANARQLVFERVAMTSPKDIIVSGGARGVDTYARQAARFYRRRLVEHFPDYERFGGAAPTMRNFDIVCEADEGFAVTWGSSGTANTVGQFARATKSCLVLKVPFVPCNNPRCELAGCQPGRNKNWWQRTAKEPHPRPRLSRGDIVGPDLKPLPLKLFSQHWPSNEG